MTRVEIVVQLMAHAPPALEPNYVFYFERAERILDLDRKRGQLDQLHTSPAARVTLARDLVHGTQFKIVPKVSWFKRLLLRFLKDVEAPR